MRTRAYNSIKGLVNVLYWTQGGRDTLWNLLAQAALQQGDVQGALALGEKFSDNHLLYLQAYSLEERWRELLSLRLPEKGDSRF
ncbi:MAG: hypothetical protein R2865_13415 [Deinococcales bacterium]